jgi:hypothetical protein
MGKSVLRKLYKGCDIRSSPSEGLQIKGPAKWKVRLDITFPNRDGSKTIPEYLDDKRRYLTQSEAHTAGFEYGRKIIDKWIREHTN